MDTSVDTPKQAYKFALLFIANLVDSHKCLVQVYIPKNYENYQDILDNLLDNADFTKYNSEILKAEGMTVEDYMSINKEFKLQHPKMIQDNYSIVLLVQVKHKTRHFYKEMCKAVIFDEDFKGSVVDKLKNILLKTLQQYATQEKMIYV